MEAVPARTFLAQYTGEVLAKEELENRMANLYQMGQQLYLGNNLKKRKMK